ncbi:bifunctional phosphopantothenoylcysteine decarboxylase/phosphopantothenate--cysteine ligase CoaBC [Algimonas porphyrae]|uniref:Coenzyme A biosynthesis bifunctional protein CoaBC n=1 Tax=Algimonas porphyrae TaxID=1128113 RepID=A0ABQ5UZZ6_9PROT|nr:bifunctional phosphopantothenoylcysteine decarboxylase/phosphopantothenate--cysteine ligase CoaBC [Algimonas porphyrae]GLQ19941.1 phosphopantothenate synthase [Algimonas porphyrae]
MNKHVLLIIGGGIAAYKSLLLIRELARRGVSTRVILTKGGTQFVTPLSAQALSGETVLTDLWDLTAESEMGHIELSRSADLIVVAPATANLMAQAAQGVAADLATTTLLATDTRVLYAPAMNVRMYEATATQANIATLRDRGALFVGPDAGEMACGEFGDGRMAEPDAIADSVMSALQGDMSLDGLSAPKPLAGRRAVVTAGPTREPIDPVRYLSNHSSGRQGYAVAQALADLGADVELVSGPTAIPLPHGTRNSPVETAEEMFSAVKRALPADIFVSVAAVADWRPATRTERKTKKPVDGPAPLQLVENPDILRSVCLSDKRPELVVGFAAETHDVLELARAKRVRKGCDWIVANDVSGDVMGGQENMMIIVTETDEIHLPRQSKTAAARALARRIASHFGGPS